MKKLKISKLSVIFIFLGSILIATIISVVWGFFFIHTTKNDIAMFNQKVHIKREIDFENIQVKNAIKMIESTRTKAYENLKKTLKERDYRAWVTAEKIYEKYKNTENDKQIQQRILDSLRYQVFDRGKGYYFITSLNGTEVLSPQANLIGKNLLNNKKYAQSIKKEIELVKKHREGFVGGSFFYKGRLQRRIAYLKLFKPFKWYIGCGRFITMFKSDTEKAILQELKYAFGSFKNPSLLVIKLNLKNNKCAGKVILYTNQSFNGHTCLSLNDKYITYPDKRPCIKNCFNKLLKKGSLTTQLIWPFHKSKIERKRIVSLYYYKPFNWIVGSCAPESINALVPNFKNNLKTSFENYSKNLFVLSILISVVIAAVMWIAIFLKLIYKPISNDIQNIVNFFESYKPYKRINLKGIKVKEFEKIAKNVNRLFDELETKNRKVEKLLEHFLSTAENMPDCLGIFERENPNNDFTLTYANSKILNCRYLPDHIIGKNLKEIFKNSPDLQKSFLTSIDNDSQIQFSTKCPFSEEIVGVTIYKIGQNSIAFLFREITEIVNLFKENERSKNMLGEFMDKIKTGIVVLDKRANVKYINVFAKHLLGISDNEKLRLENLVLPEHIKYKFVKILHNRETCEICEINLTTLDGKNKWFEVYPATFKIGKEFMVIVSFNDITQRYLKNKQLEYLSFHDSLTGVYNRRYLEEELKRLFNRRNYPLAFILIDLNGLKIANDILGHEVGDKLLTKTANILLKTTRGNDIVARIGGDEFAIVMPNTDKNGIEAFIKRVKEKINESNRRGNLLLSISFGYAIQTAKYKHPDELFKEADKNMYANKYSKGRRNTLKEIIKWAISAKKAKDLSKTDEDYFMSR